MTRADQLGIAITFKGMLAVANALIRDDRKAEAREVECMALRLREIGLKDTFDQEAKDEGPMTTECAAGCGRPALDGSAWCSTNWGCTIEETDSTQAIARKERAT